MEAIRQSDVILLRFLVVQMFFLGSGRASHLVLV